MHMSRLIFSLLLALVLITACSVERPKPEFDLAKVNMGLESGLALNKAYDLYQQAIENGQDLSDGPCLSNSLHGNPDHPQTMWVLDIAHNPRESADNQPVNQCQAYREGLAENFIELDPAGQLIRLYSPSLSNN